MSDTLLTREPVVNFAVEDLPNSVAVDDDILGTEGNDVLTGTDDDDVIFGGEGNDTI